MNRLTNKKLANLKEGEFISLSKQEYHKQVKKAPTYKELYQKVSKLEDLMETHCENCINRQNNICLGFDCILDIETLIKCKEYDLQNYKDGISDFVLWLKGHTYRPENLYSDIMKKLQELNLIGKEIE